ncbi:uncharacterized protein C2orf42 homolog isoform X1 [Oryzias melastigma]|uniref:uncharacterized protein C2orf42 homolog isoform X1 n=1 Tax=Oryzias melastigma TaxID=30732 RepID=UPI000CF7F5EA|nr:uncharacterized protein C2orf42 homolog isoform X1 [Oryzias melastigma]XP_024154765.1 uncharacterized protein C2orf42 homolog isoform X1 [Oryzias melastigma]
MDSEGAETSSVTPSTSRVSLAAKQRDSRRAAATTPSFLSNLGKATLRGIRRCPQCGVFNGTRGISCKNKACGVSLRNAPGAAKSSKRSTVEVVRLITDAEEKGGKSQEDGGVLGGGSGGGAEVFSVCHRGRGRSQWGFVELVPTDTAIATGDGTTLLTRINLGRCFLPYCKQSQRLNQREADPAAVKPSSDSLCIHIRQAIECQSRATPLTLKSSVLDSLQVSAELREELWKLAIFSPGPLVQQVSKDTLVVKCQPDSHHPLGLLHFRVNSACPSEASKGERSVFHCACQVCARSGKPGANGAGREHPACSTLPQPCLHFYACVWAFASSKKLTPEFAAFPEAASSSSSCGVPLKPSVTSNSDEKVLLQPDTQPPHPKAMKICLDESSFGKAPPAAWKEGASASGPRKAAGRKAGGVKAAGSPQVMDECTLTMSFQQWLAGVTERIHQTMDYQCDGRPEPLVYHIPQEFFNALQQRLSLGSKKRRLPNFTTAFLRTDGAPAGSFSKYTWHITNLLQVKRIFDTPELPLEITQSFVRNADGSYSRFRCPDPQPKQEPLDGSRADRPQAIRPMELRTFLKVGPADQKEASPFVIEWIPDVLPRCQMGELRISFEFGHQQSGQPDHADRKGTAEKGGGKLDFNQSNVKQAAEILQVV